MLNVFTSDPEIMGGEVCLTGTRITAWAVLDAARSGRSASEICEMYGGKLEIDQVAAVLSLCDFRGDPSSETAFDRLCAYISSPDDRPFDVDDAAALMEEIEDWRSME